MAKNIADEITEAETAAKQLIQDARAEGAKILAKAKSDSEEKVKEARQRFHRSFRDGVMALEKNAEAEAKKIVDKGSTDAERLVEQYKGKIQGAASWVAEEVIGRYGSKKV